MSRDDEPRRHVDRAAQFMPFAALTGYYDLVRQRAEAAAHANWDELGNVGLWPDDAASGASDAPLSRTAPPADATPGDSARRSPRGRP